MLCMSYLVMIFLACCLALVATEQPTSGRQSATPSESMTTHLASNGTIIFGNLNSSGTYTLGDYLDSYEGQAGPLSLVPYTAIATSFVDTLIRVPWDLIVRLKDSNFQLNVIINDWQEYAKLEAPMLVPFVVGVLLSIIVPGVGLGLCCCRCCGRCGGKYSSKEAEKKSQCCGFLVGFGLVISCIFIILGTCGFVGSSRRLHNTLPHFAEAAVHAVDDFSLFKDKFFEDLDLVSIGEFKNVANIMSSELDRLPDEVTGPFMLAGRPVVRGITGNLLGLDKDLDALKVRLSEVDSLSTQVTTSGNSIRALIKELKANLTTLKTTCSGSPDCSHMMDPNDVPSVYDFSKTPNVRAETASLDPVLSLDLKGIATKANNTFEDIPKQVNATAFDKANDIKETIDGLIEPVKDVLDNSVKPIVNELFDSLAFNATMLKHEIRSHAEIVTNKTGFKQYFLIGLCSLPAVIVLLALLGLCHGGFGTKCRPTVKARNRVSHTGARLNWSSSWIIFIVIFWFLLIGAIVFLLGSHLTFICSPIKDETIFSEFLDKPEYWNDSYIMGDLLFEDGSVPLKLGEIITDCAASKGIYGALKLDNLFTIYDFVNLTERLPDTSSLYVAANKAVQDVTLLEDASRQKFADAIASPPNIDVEALMKGIKDGLAGITLTKTISDLEQAASEMSDPTFKDAYINMANRLRTSDTFTLPTLSSAVAHLNTKIQNISLTTTRIMGTTGNVLTGVDSMQDFLKNAGSSMMIQSMADYVARLVGIGDQFLAYVQNSLVNSVGSCKVVHDIYRILSESVCQTFLGGLNDYWLSLNVIGLFFIILLILNFKISNYYRAVHNIRPKQDYDLGSNQNSTKKWNAHFKKKKVSINPKYKADEMNDNLSVVSMDTSDSSPTRRSISDVISTWFGFGKNPRKGKDDWYDPTAPFPGFTMADLKRPRRSVSAVVCSWVTSIKNCREPKVKIVWNPIYERKNVNLNNSNSAGFDISNSTPARRSISDVISTWFGRKATQEKPNLTTADVFSVFSDDGSQDKNTGIDNLAATSPRRSISDVISTWFGLDRKAKVEKPDLTTEDVFSVFSEDTKEGTMQKNGSQDKNTDFDNLATTSPRRSISDVISTWFSLDRKATVEKPDLTSEDVFSVFGEDTKEVKMCTNCSKDKNTDFDNLATTSPRRSISDVISTWFAVFALPHICCNRNAKAKGFDLTTADVFSVFGSKVKSDSKDKQGTKNNSAIVNDMQDSRYKKSTDEKPTLTTEDVFSVFGGDDNNKAKKLISDTFKFGRKKKCDANNAIAYLTNDDIFSTFGEEDKKKSCFRNVFCYLPNLLLRMCYSPNGKRSCPVSRCSRSETNVEQVIINMPEMNCENGLPPHLAHIMYVPCLTPIAVLPEFKMENELVPSGSGECDLPAYESEVSATLAVSSTEI